MERWQHGWTKGRGMNHPREAKQKNIFFDQFNECTEWLDQLAALHSDVSCCLEAGESNCCFLAFWPRTEFTIARVDQWPCHFKSLCTLKYRHYEMSKGAQEQILRRTRRTRLSTVYKWTSLQSIIIGKKSISLCLLSITASYLHLPYFLVISSPVFSLGCSLFTPPSRPQHAFPLRERNFLTWRKRSGTDTNMICLWH